MKKKVDIEKLVMWAINDELPKGQAIMRDIWTTVESYARNRSGMMKAALEKYGDRDTGGFVDGEAHADAITLARIIKEFDIVQGLPNARDAKDILGSLLVIDANCIHTAMAVMPKVAALIISCAVLRRPPVCDVRIPRARPIKRASNGRPLVLREDVDGDLMEANVKDWRRDFIGSPRCPLEWDDPHPEQLAEQRAEYVIWHRALVALAQRARTMLVDFEPLPPARPERPWLVQAPTVPPRVLVSCLPSSLRNEAPPKGTGCRIRIRARYCASPKEGMPQQWNEYQVVNESGKIIARRDLLDQATRDYPGARIGR